MFARSLILAFSLAAPAAAYTKKDREDAIKWITEEKGFPHLAAFDKMVLRGVLRTSRRWRRSDSPVITRRRRRCSRPS